jgi:hypothetical protein
MAFTQTWDETFPSDTQLAAMGADDIRRLTYAVRERLAVDHYNLAVEGGDAKIGFHKKASFVDQVADLLGVASATVVYGKTVAGVIELFLVLSDNTAIQLTNNGKLWIEALNVAAQINKDLIRFDGMKWTRYAWTTLITDLLADADFTAWAATFKNAGDVVQVVNYQTGAVATGSNVNPITYDDSIPQNNEGDEYLSLTITPTSASNQILIFV